MWTPCRTSALRRSEEHTSELQSLPTRRSSDLETGAGSDILGGALKRDDSSNDTLYFKFHVDALSDVGTEEYFAGFQLYEGDVERLAVGNSLKAYAYSAFNTATNGEIG